MAQRQGGLLRPRVFLPFLVLEQSLVTLRALPQLMFCSRNLLSQRRDNCPCQEAGDDANQARHARLPLLPLTFLDSLTGWLGTEEQKSGTFYSSHCGLFW